jgi:hypothetical protein
MGTKRKPTTREEMRELLHERWPTLPFELTTLRERIDRAEVEVDRLEKIVAKRKAAKP